MKLSAVFIRNTPGLCVVLELYKASQSRYFVATYRLAYHSSAINQRHWRTNEKMKRATVPGTGSWYQPRLFLLARPSACCRSKLARNTWRISQLKALGNKPSEDLSPIDLYRAVGRLEAGRGLGSTRSPSLELGSTLFPGPIPGFLVKMLQIDGNVE